MRASQFEELPDLLEEVGQEGVEDKEEADLVAAEKVDHLRGKDEVETIYELEGMLFIPFGSNTSKFAWAFKASPFCPDVSINLLYAAIILSVSHSRHSNFSVEIILCLAVVDCVCNQLNSLYLGAFDLAYRSHYIVGYLLVARLSGGLTGIVVLWA